MRALTVQPGQADSLAVEDIDEPTAGPDEMRVAGLAIGVCGTDKEIAAGAYGWLRRDVIAWFSATSRWAGCSARPTAVTSSKATWWSAWCVDPIRCPAAPAPTVSSTCAATAATPNGVSKRSTDTAAKSGVWKPITQSKIDDALAEVGMLMEPTTVVAKAWEQVYRVGQRAWFEPRTALVTGAGPIGLLAALLGVQHGLEVHVLDRVTDGPKPGIVDALNATYHHTSVEEAVGKVQPDIVIEATGVGSLVFDAMKVTGSYGIVALTGVSPTGRNLTVDAGGLNRDIVLENDAVVGSVNANLRHYRQAAEALAKAIRRGWPA